MEITKWLHPFRRTRPTVGKRCLLVPDTGTPLNRPPVHLLASVVAVMCSRPSSVSVETTGETTMDTQLPGSAPPFTAPTTARPGNGLAVAALVLGLDSLVAAVALVFFPLAL